MKTVLRGLVCAMAGLLLACSGGGGGAGGSVPSTSLIVTVLNIEGEPLPGVDVVLHAPDARSVEQALATDDNGVADFGDIGRTQVTVTAVRSSEGNTELLTHVAVPGGNRTVVFSDPVSLEIDGRVSATFSVNSTDPEAVLLTDGSSDDNLSDGEANFDDVIVVAPNALGVTNLGNDNTLSLLAVTVGADEMLNQYGFTLDQPYSDGAHYTGTIDRVAANMPWTADGAGAVFIALLAERKGVSFFLGQDTTAGMSGGFPSLREFPADRYLAQAAQAEGDPGDASVSWRRSWAAVPDQIDIDFADFSRSDLEYDAQAAQYSWQRTGSGANVQLLERYEQAEDNFRSSAWLIRMPATRSQFVLPDLPPDLEARISRSGDNDFAGLTAADFLAASDYAAVDRLLTDFATSVFLGADLDVVFITEPGNEVTPPEDEEPPGEDDPMIPGLPGLPGLP